jgi:hypothetical protein
MIYEGIAIREKEIEKVNDSISTREKSPQKR